MNHRSAVLIRATVAVLGKWFQSIERAYPYCSRSRAFSHYLNGNDRISITCTDCDFSFYHVFLLCSFNRNEKGHALNGMSFVVIHRCVLTLARMEFRLGLNLAGPGYLLRVLLPPGLHVQKENVRSRRLLRMKRQPSHCFPRYVAHQFQDRG